MFYSNHSIIMKRLTRTELIEEAAKVFDQYLDVEKVIAVTDGNIFLPEAEGHANYHARVNGHTTMVISRAEVIQASNHEFSDPAEDNPVSNLEDSNPNPVPKKNPDVQTRVKKQKESEKSAKTGNRLIDTQNHIEL